MAKLFKNQPPKACSGPVCIICNASESTSLYTYQYTRESAQYSSDILQCQSCRHLFIHPVPLVNLQERTMDAIEDATFFGNRLFEYLHEKLVINREIHAVQKFITAPSPSLLDIGCVTGWTTSLFEKKGFRAVGLEPSAVRAQFGKEKYGIEIYQCPIETFAPKEKFDLVIMRHLLEHVENPLSVLERVRTFLNDNGVLLIIIPNINSIGRYVFQENWQWILPWHLHFYAPRTLTALLEKTGYKTLKSYQIPSPLWYPSSFSNAFPENSKIKNFFDGIPSFIKFIPFLPLIFIGFILNLNDNMPLIAQKK